MSKQAARLSVIAIMALAIIVAVAVLPPLPQPGDYGRFVDQRTIWGIANCFDVISNLPFLLVGLWGLIFIGRANQHPGAFANSAERWPYAVCFLAIAMVSAGSAYYHLAPDNGRLFWDRLPMSIGFMALLSAVVVERLNVKLGLVLLLPLVLIGAGSVIHWRWSALQGAENLIPYIAVQYGSIAIMLAITLLFPSRYTRGADLYVVVVIYTAAKVSEAQDAQIYALGQLVSGHTLKHLLAGLAVWWILHMLQSREIVGAMKN
jgi:hypothetical protein